MVRRTVVLFWLLTMQIVAIAQFNCMFSHFSTGNGLSQGSIEAIIRDHEGYIWIGTWDGLNRYDGYSFKVYKSVPGDYNSLSTNRIAFLMEDQWGFIWVKTYDSKVYRFNKLTEKFEGLFYTRPDQTTIHVKAEKIEHFSGGDIWLTTKGRGIFRVTTNKKDLSIAAEFYPFVQKSNLNYEREANFVIEDRLEQIWAVTGNGLNLLARKPGSDVYINSTNQLKNHHLFADFQVISKLELNDNLWFGTTEGMLIQFNQNSKAITGHHIGNSSPIKSISYSGNSQTILLATYGNGLIEFDCRKMKAGRHINDPLVKNIRSVYIDKSKLIWIDTDEKGIVKLDPVSYKLKHFKQKSKISAGIKNACQFQEDEHGILWIKLGGFGFGYYDRKADTFNYFFNDPDDHYKKLSNNVSHFLIDSTGVMWLSTFLQGIEKITFLSEAFRHRWFKEDKGDLRANEVRCIYEDRFKNLWIATRDGILHLFDKDNRPIRSFSADNSNLKGVVFCMAEDSRGNLFAGTKGNGIYELKGVESAPVNITFKGYSNVPGDRNSLSNNDVYAILPDKKGRLWIGTYGGGLNLMEYGNNGYSFVNTNNSLLTYPRDLGQKIRHVQEDAFGGIWMATTDGLMYFNPDSGKYHQLKFSHFNKIPGDIHSLGNNETHYIYRDKLDTLWIGTMGGGLNQVISYPENELPPKFRNYSREEGLSSDIILSITGDEAGNLWLGTGNGLSNFNRKRHIFKNYDEYDGLAKTQYSEAACQYRANGELLFGSLNGYYSFFQDSLKPPSAGFGKLVINSFSVYNKEIKSATGNFPLSTAIPNTKMIELAHDQNVISIEYGVLNSIAPHKIEYAYQLEGFDEQWYYVKNQRIANYIKIPPGKYIFKVKVVNDEVSGRNEVRQLGVTILPPPWKTNWAYTVYLLLFLVVLGLSRRIVMEMLHLRNELVVEHRLTELKMGFFTDVSHELRTPLTLILGPLGEISRDEQLTQQGRQYIGLIEKNARRMLRLVNHILDFRKVEEKKMKLQLKKVDMVSFVREITDHFVALAIERNISFSFETEINYLETWVDEEKLDIVIYNLLSNAFKFTDGGKKITVKLCALAGESSYRIDVSDEGIGIPAEKIPLLFNRFVTFNQPINNHQKGTGIGLTLSKELVALHKGTLGVESVEGFGSTFTITMKAGREHFTADEIFLSEDNKVHSQLYTSDGEQLLANGNSSEIELPDRHAPLLMLVEDHSELRNFLSAQFRRKFRIVEAIDGAEGLIKARKLLPDLIVSDVMMPNMDGIEMLDHLKNDFKTSHIPVILLSAKSTVENQVEGLRYGADIYMTKPFSPEILIYQVENLLQQRRKLMEYLRGENKKVELNPENVMVTSKDEEFLKQLTRIVDDNIPNSNFNIEEIAAVVGLGRSSFFKKVKGLTGFAPVELVRDFRIKRAVQLMQSGDYSISEIAFLSGFNSAAYFSTCFKEKYLETPSEYQKRAKQGLLT